MRIFANVHILAKLEQPWEDANGNQRTAYKANIMQNQGEIIDILRLTPAQFEKIENGKDYTVSADLGNGKNGPFLRIIDIFATK